MKFHRISAVLCLFASLCNAQTKDKITPFSSSATIVKQATGDLDKDGIDETVAIQDIQTGKDNLGLTRVMTIYKTTKGKTTLWKKSIIDRIENVNSPRNKYIDTLFIIRNTIVLKQELFLGGRKVIKYAHRFRFQNADWYLIGSKMSYVTNCYGADVCDINFSTGTIDISFVPDGGCDDEPEHYATLKGKHQSYKHKFAKIPLLDGLKIGENNFSITEKKIDCYY